MIRETLHLAIKAIFKNKLRSFLTMLGIIIGTAAVVIIMNVMVSFQNYMTEQFQSIGTLNIISTILSQSNGLEVSEVDEFINNNSDVLAGYSPILTLPKTEVAKVDGTEGYETTLYGAGQGYDKINQYRFSEGTYLNYIDITESKPSVVLGSYTANRLFGDQEAVGQKIMVNGRYYTVRGVLESRFNVEGANSEGSYDDMIIIPFSLASQSTLSTKLTNIIYQATDEDSVDEAYERLKTFYASKISDDDGYFIEASKQILDSLNEVTSYLNIILIVITSISLLVGGIGIMNIMFISVIERTQEIGIRTAIGARPKVILEQFLVEAIITSFIGGVIGVIIGLIIAYIGCEMVDMKFSLSLSSLVIAFIFSIGIGCLFGYLPAKKAAYLNPISALSSE